MEHTHRGSYESVGGRESIATRSSSVSSLASRNEGWLLKQSDHLLEWRHRYFKVEKNVLYYYIPDETSHKNRMGHKDPEDYRKEPKGARQLPTGTVVTDGGERWVGDVVYYIFKIEHKTIRPSYLLAATSQQERSAWTRAIKAAVAGEQPGRFTFGDARSMSSGDLSSASSWSIASAGAPLLTLSQDSIKRMNSSGRQAQTVRKNITEGTTGSTQGVLLNGAVLLSGIAPHLEAQMLAGIPPNYLEDIYKATTTLLQGSRPRAEGWEKVLEKEVNDNVEAAKKISPDGSVCFRTMTTLPFTIPEIFAASSTAAARKDLDSQLLEYTRLKWFSRHTGLEYLRCKGGLRGGSKEYCNLTHWRLQDCGAFVYLAFSAPDLCPERSDIVPSQLLLDGYVMRPIPGGTSVCHVIQTDLVNPSTIATIHAAKDHTRTLLALKDRLARLHADEERATFTEPPVPSYDELLAVTMNNHDAPYPDTEKNNAELKEDTVAKPDLQVPAEPEQELPAPEVTLPMLNYDEPHTVAADSPSDLNNETIPEDPVVCIPLEKPQEVGLLIPEPTAPTELPDDSLFFD